MLRRSAISSPPRPSSGDPSREARNRASNGAAARPEGDFLGSDATVRYQLPGSFQSSLVDVPASGFSTMI
jgi:hypothetical protein